MLTGVAVALPVIYLTHLLPLPQPDGRAAAAAARRIAEVQPWKLILPALIAYPLLEECFYRGLILQLLRRYAPLWLAVLIPALLFGVTHLGFSLQNAIFAVVVGIYFSWLTIGSRSLFPAILCHAAVNASVVFVLRPVLGGSGDANLMAFARPLPLVLLGGSLALFTIGAKTLAVEFRRQSSGVNTAGGKG